MAAGYGEHFAQVAADYDALRREATDDVLRWIAASGRYAPGLALLDVGCGTGATTAALAHRHGLDAVGLDPSPAMLDRAGARAGERCRFVRGRAEALPFAAATFDRVLLQTSVHLVDRPRALPEVRRVLRGDGALTVVTVDPAGFDGFWLARWFPSYAAIDRARFPTAPVLARELREAGFGPVDVRPRARELAFTRERALAMLRGRFASSFALMDDAEYEAGVARAARELPATFESTLHLLVLTAAPRSR